MGLLGKALKNKWKDLRGTSEPEDVVRVISSPSDLIEGDHFTCCFLPQKVISHVATQVGAVHYEQFAEDDIKPVYALENELIDEAYFYIDENRQGHQRSTFMLPLLRDDVFKLFDNEAVAAIFDTDDMAHLPVISDDNTVLSPWIADLNTTYHQENFQQMYYLKKQDSEGEEADFYRLINDDGDKAIHIYIYEGGETEFYAVVHHDMSVIEAF